jgi:hypothetical protein
VSTNIKLANGVAKYALYPVWILNTSWDGLKYVFAMNGQTGKLVGNLPMDKNKFYAWFAGLFAAGTAVAFALAWLSRGMMLLIRAVMVGIRNPFSEKEEDDG